MATQIFLNLPVKDLKKSIEFFARLGYEFNPQFTDENATCMIVNEHIYVMLLVEKFFKSFTHKEICNSRKAIEAMVTLSAESREKVDEMVNNAVAAGATTPNPTQDLGWMYARGFEDLDGHHWDFVYMDMSAMPQS